MSDLINRQTAINTLLKAYPLMQREKLVEVMETVPGTETGDCISRQAVMKEFSDFVRKSNNSDFAPTPTWNDAVSLVGSMPSVQPQACDDAISRDDAIMAVRTGALSAATIFGRTDEGATAYYETVKAIKALPSAQPERKKGKWIRTRTMEHDGEMYCDQCEQEHPEQKIIWNFCPNCGADMRGESE